MFLLGASASKDAKPFESIEEEAGSTLKRAAHFIAAGYSFSGYDQQSGDLIAGSLHSEASITVIPPDLDNLHFVGPLTNDTQQLSVRGVGHRFVDL